MDNPGSQMVWIILVPTINLYPRNKNLIKDKHFHKIKSIIIKNHLPSNGRLSVSFRHGRALLYNNPFIYGSEKKQDSDYLLSVGKAIKGICGIIK